MAVLDQEDQLVAPPEDMETGGVLRQPNGQPGAWVTPPQSGVLPPVGLPRGASITAVAPGDVMPPMAQAGTGIISTPGGGAYVAHRDPALAYAEINAQKQKDYELAMEQWQRGKTMEQIEAGVQANTRQMGMSGYQREIASGVPAAEALAKWAPMMFYGGAKTKLPVSPKPTYRNVPNVGLVEVSPTGQSRVVQAVPPTPASEVQRITNPTTGLQEGLIVGKSFHPMKEPELTGDAARENENLKQEISATAKAWTKETDATKKGELRLQHDWLVDRQRKLYQQAAAMRQVRRPDQANQISPLPKNKSDLVKGQRYSVRGKTWEWDGEKLVATE